MATIVADKRIHPNALDGLVAEPEPVELAASLRISQVLPVGRLVANAGEARLLDKRLKQNGSVGVGRVPVVR